MTTGKSFDHQQALSEPCGVFGEPANVLSHLRLPKAGPAKPQRIEVRAD